MRKALRTTAVLALPSLINAVALSDMTPRATGLPSACENLYTAQIAGCIPSDFTSQQCSSSCVNALEALVGPIQKACGGQGVQGQNLVVAFLAGVGPQQLCHNAGSATTKATTQSPTTTPTPSIISSTTTARTATDTKSLIVDTSSSMSPSASSTSTKKPTTKHTPIPVASSSAPQTTSQTPAASTSHSSSTKTTSASGNSQTNFNDGSGGGSPFDTPGNLINAAAGRSISALSLFLPAVAAVMVATLR